MSPPALSCREMGIQPASRVGCSRFVPSSDQPSRRLGVVPAIALVAGSMLGIGIFIAPPVVAQHAHQPGTFLALWLVGGLSALFGAMCVAELGAMMPLDGGDYLYLRRAYGPGLAYAAGWLQLLAIFPGSLAVMAVGTASYQLPALLGDAYDWPTIVGLSPGFGWAVAIVLALTLLNIAGVRLSGWVQTVLTGIPIAILVVAIIWVFARQGINDGGAWSQTGHADAFDHAGLESLAVAFLPVYFAYSGWNAALYVGGEIRHPARNLPRALVGGTLSVTVLYMLLCLGFLAMFNMDALANTGEAGTAAARAMFGGVGEFVITTLIGLAMLGSINSSILGGSRVGYAMARDGYVFDAAGRINARTGTPVVALLLQAGWTIVLIASQSFEQLVNYTSAAMLITGTLTVMSVVVLRRKFPEASRPYKTWGYPWTPILYSLSSVAVLLLLTIRGMRGDGEDRAQDISVFLAAAWFAAALLYHRVVVVPRTAREIEQGHELDGE